MNKPLLLTLVVLVCVAALAAVLHFFPPFAFHFGAL